MFGYRRKAWNPIGIAPEGRWVLVIFEDGDVCVAKWHGTTDGHNNWWDLNGLDFGYGSSTPIGWLPRDVLPETPLGAIQHRAIWRT